MTSTNIPYSRKLGLALGMLLAIVLIVKYLTPVLALNYVNSTINDIDGLQGNIDDLDLSILSGEYSVVGINILQTSEDGVTPIFAAQQIDVALSWTALFSGEIVTEINLTKPILLAFDASEEQSKVAPVKIAEETWLGLANDLTPFFVDQVNVVDGQVQFRAIGASFFGELLLTDINGALKDLHNDASSSLLTSVNFEGLIGDSSTMKIDGRLNPNHTKASFDINVEVSKIPHQVTKDLIAIYAPFDIEAGELDFAAELISEKGQVDGYVKMGVFDLDVFSWQNDVVEDKDNPLQLFIEGVSGLFGTLIENGKSESIATRVPIKGTLDNTEVSLSTAIVGLFRNAFVEAYNMKVENIVSFESSENNGQPEDSDR